MMTIVGGYLVRLEPSSCCEFSFLLGLVTLTAAAGYKSVTKWEVMNQHLSIGPVLFGCLVAGSFCSSLSFLASGLFESQRFGRFCCLQNHPLICSSCNFS